MTDLHSSSINSNEGSSYSFGCAKYWCQSCQRQFSHIRIDATSTQARCPRCNLYGDEVVSSPPTNTRSVPPRSSPVYYATQTVVDPFTGTVFIQNVPVQSVPTNTQQSGYTNNIFSNSFGPLFGFASFMQPTFFADEATMEAFLHRDPDQCGAPAASQEAIDNLQQVSYTGEGAEISCCPVCHEDYKEGESLVRLPCKHDYHGECVKTWLNKHNSCPMCRKAI